MVRISNASTTSRWKQEQRATQDAKIRGRKELSKNLTLFESNTPKHRSSWTVVHLFGSSDNSRRKATLSSPKPAHAVGVASRLFLAAVHRISTSAGYRFAKGAAPSAHAASRARLAAEPILAGAFPVRGLVAGSFALRCLMRAAELRNHSFKEAFFFGWAG